MTTDERPCTICPVHWQSEANLLREALAMIVGAFTSGIYCANCGEGVEMCGCVIDLGRTALYPSTRAALAGGEAKP